MSKIEEDFKKSITTAKVPVLTLDHKWYRLFRDLTEYPDIISKEKELNELLKLQGRRNSEIKEIKRLKKKLMDEIVSMADESELGGGNDSEKKLSDNKKLIEECNEKLEAYQEDINTMPEKITEKNKELMLETCMYCYESLHSNQKEIKELEEYLDQMKEELRKALIRKQSMEIQNRQIYSYMSEIFQGDTNQLFHAEEP